MTNKIDVYIARHFWRDGQVATWQTSEQFSPVLLSWLKEHYTELVAGERPSWVERPEGVLYLFFKDEHEEHGRLATGITAFWSETDVIDRDKFHERLNRSPALPNNKILSLKINANILKRKEFSKKSLIFFIAALSVIGVGYLIVMQPSEQNETTEIVHMKEPALDRKRPIEFESKAEVDSLTSSGICDQSEFSPHAPSEYCYQKFIKMKCSEETVLNYDAWLKELHKNNDERVNMLHCPPTMDIDKLNGDLKYYLEKQTENKQKELIMLLQRSE
ncbi:hypothetical protein ACFL0B_08270 [Thermodesulfobacteriota bacterium]